MTSDDRFTLAAMRAYGGSFFQHLGLAALYADENNLAKLKAAFPEEWEKYEQMSKRENE